MKNEETFRMTLHGSYNLAQKRVHIFQRTLDTQVRRDETMILNCSGLLECLAWIFVHSSAAYTRYIAPYPTRGQMYTLLRLIPDILQMENSMLITKMIM